MMYQTRKELVYTNFLERNVIGLLVKNLLESFIVSICIDLSLCLTFLFICVWELEFKNRDPNYFKQLGENAKKQQLDKTEKQYQQSVGIVTASYEIALLVAKNKKPHTIAEEFIMPAAKMLVKHVIGDEAVSKLNSTSMSNNMIQQHITEMSTDIKEQVITEVQGSKYGFAIQLVESTDMPNYAQLLVYVCYATKDAIRSELLLINEMRTTTKGEDVFELVDNFFKKK